MAEDELNKLKRKRGCIRGFVTKHITKIENDILNPDIKVDDLEEFLEILKEKNDELVLINSQIENLIKIDEIEEELQSSEDYKQKIMKTKLKVSRLLKNKESEIQSNSNTNIIQNNSNQYENQNKTKERVKLPKLIIPKFFGDISEWINFWNSFNSSINENENLSKIDKFIYLRSFLGGSAFSVIDGLELTENHFDIAIDFPKQIFGDKNIMINFHR